MFSKPKTSTWVAPEEPIDPTLRYIVRLVDLTDTGISKFADPNEADPAHSLLWTFRLYKTDKTPILDVDGNPYEMWAYTSSKTGKGRGKVARAREWIEALLGRCIEDDEITDDLPEQIKNKTALALFEERTWDRDDGTTGTGLKILKLAPYKAENKNGNKPMPERETVETTPQRGPAVADNPFDLPF